MLPPQVVAVCASFLEAVPDGLVTGLYLRGGTGFGEWVPGQSDVDFLATLSDRPSERDADALRRAHLVVGAAHPDVHFDGAHLLASDLANEPAACPEVPCVLERAFEVTKIHDGMVAWHELAWHGSTVRGRPHQQLGIWTDQDRLLAFTCDNLDSYWRRVADSFATDPAGAATEQACTWCVLGVARLHHLLVTGVMTTKSGAGRWGREFYPARFHRVLTEALRIREGGASTGRYVGDPAERGRDTAAFTAYVVSRSTAVPMTGAP